MKPTIETTLREAPHLTDVSRAMRRLIEPLVEREQGHYRGYSDEDYAALLINSENGARPSVRCAAVLRRKRARSVQSLSPAISTVYGRLTTGMTPKRLQSIATDVAVSQLLAHCRPLGNGSVKLFLDEFDESSTSRSLYNGSEAPTPVGALMQPRKRHLALQKRAQRKSRYHPFLDHDMIGLEHMAVMGETVDGERFLLATHLTNGPGPQVSHIHVMNDVQRRLEAVGLAAQVRVADRRWDGEASVAWLDSQPGPWLVRGKMTGTDSFRPTNAAQRKQLKAQARGDKPWSRKQLVQRLWNDAQFLPNLKNVLGASIRARPYQTSEFECTVVVIYSLRRGYRLKANEDLHPSRNLTKTIILTNRPPGPDTVAWAHATYAERWDIEVDIKEHKSYVNPGSGPKPFMRVLKEQVAMILENLATYLRAYQARHGERTFVRYAYNDMVTAYVAYDAVEGGWSPAILISAAGPPYDLN